MPRVNNDQIGVCICPSCGTGNARVHRMKKSSVKKLVYLFCDECGCLQPTRPTGQNQILKTTELFAPGEFPDLQARITELQKPPEPEPEPQRKPAFAWLLGDDEDD